MSTIGAALGAALLSPLRAEASRINGAKSRGPKTAEGKARSAQNALRHGLSAKKFVVVGDESAAKFAALEAALVGELEPVGALQGLLAGRIARAAWRLERAERIEAELFAHEMGDRDLGLALIRDGNGARAFDTLLRYRGTALAELWRALRLLKALQAEAAQQTVPSAARLPEPQTPAGIVLEQPIEPEARQNPGEAAAMPLADQPAAELSGRPDAECAPPDPEARPQPRENPPASRENPPASPENPPASRENPPASRENPPASRENPPASRENPNEPESRRNPGEIFPAPDAPIGRSNASTPPATLHRSPRTSKSTMS